jgi:hypothetical protein
MNDSKSTRSVVPLTVLVLFGLAVAATVTVWLVFTTAERGAVAWTTLAFLLLVQTGYLALFLAGWVSASLERALPTAVRVIASTVWTLYAVIGLLTLTVWAGAAATGVDATDKALALLFAAGVLCALPVGLLFAFAATTSRSDAEREAFRARTIDSGHALGRLAGLLRTLRAPPPTLARADRIARDLDAARAALAHAPSASAEQLLGNAAPTLEELRGLADAALPAEPQALSMQLERIEQLGRQLRHSLSPALAA